MLESITTFWSIRRYLVKKSYIKIQKSLLNYTNSLCTIFNQIYSNTPKCLDTPKFYTTNAHFRKNVLISPYCILSI